MTSKHNLDQQIYFIRTLLISGLFLLSALCGLSRAQGPTTITSDGTLNTTVTQNGNPRRSVPAPAFLPGGRDGVVR